MTSISGTLLGGPCTTAGCKSRSSGAPSLAESRVPGVSVCDLPLLYPLTLPLGVLLGLRLPLLPLELLLMLPLRSRR